MIANAKEFDFSMNSENLYREEVYTDQESGSIRCMRPVKVSGEIDDTRPVLFIGQTQLLTPMGALPLTFEIEAANLQEAIAKFGDYAKESLEKTMKELQEMRREAASSIVIPGTDGSLRGMPGGGGKIQLR